MIWRQLIMISPPFIGDCGASKSIGACVPQCQTAKFASVRGAHPFAQRILVIAMVSSFDEFLSFILFEMAALPFVLALIAARSVALAALLLMAATMAAWVPACGPGSSCPAWPASWSARCFA
jgi:hypothetical protein